ncbi:MAG: N-acetylneuraminate synthase family protein, partial [Desulfobacterota bacterium]|nr:N-acetylneuraminate synthase family protein [Thermodesulfobacteriota bacterium]
MAGRSVGTGQPCLIVAEAGVNHNGRVELAKRLIECAADAGADAVKFQTFRAETLAVAQAAKADYQLRTTDRSESQFEMLRRL